MQQKISNLIARAKILANIREWFNNNNFIEVETPILVDCPDLSPNLNILETEIHTRPVETHCNASLQKQKKYLITSPEFSMKKLLSLQEMNNIFTITKVFRDGEEETGIHSIEFTMLEWYRKNADYNDIMKDTEDLITYLIFTPFHPKVVIPAVLRGVLYPLSQRGSSRFSGAGGFFDGTTISTLPSFRTSSLQKRTSTGRPVSNLPTPEKSPLPPFKKEGGSPSFPRLKISSLFKKCAKINNVEELSLPAYTKIVHSRGYSKDKNLTYEQCFNLIFLNEIESKLPKTPFFLIDYPAPLAALAKLKKNNPFIAERFELYIDGIELCNGFSELTDGKEQLARFKKETLERKNFGKPQLPIDYELCKKLDLIGKAGGNALGIDRLVMLLLGAKTIDEVLVF